jgi:hypothetical membrane protein
VEDDARDRKREVDPIALRLAQERLDQGSYRQPPRTKQKRRFRRKRAPRDQASRFVLVPATIAPLVLVGGWSLARSAQPDSYNSFRDTLSDLAAEGASHRGIMTGALIALGIAHVLTAWLLRIPAVWGRLLQALGGLATVLVAFLPLSSESDGLAHVTAAAVALITLALWPAFGARSEGPPVLHPRPMRAAALVLSLLVLWFAVALVTKTYAGLAERVATLGEALWPLIVAWLVREWGGGGGTRHVEQPPEAPQPEDDPSPDDVTGPSDDAPDVPDPTTPVGPEPETAPAGSR